MGTFGGDRRIARLVGVAGPGVLVAAGLAWVLTEQGGAIADGLASCPPWVIVAATLAHALTLVIRSEAWRLTLGAVADGRLARRTVHAANAGAFLAGTLQSHAAMPARVALLIRLSAPASPRAAQVVLADAPILLMEVMMLAALMAVAAPALGIAWCPATVVATFGAAGAATATAAGLAISATTVLAVLLYAGFSWAWRLAPRRPAHEADALQPAGAPA